MVRLLKQRWLLHKRQKNRSAQHQPWVLCPACDTLNSLPALLEAGTQASCSHCQTPLAHAQGRRHQQALALVVAAIILYVMANCFDFLSLKVVGLEQSATLFTGIAALFANNQWLLAAVVFTTVLLFPLLEIAAMVYVLVPYHLNRRLPGQVAVLRALIRAQPWSMLEIFLLAVMVTSVKLDDMARLIPGVALYAFLALVPILALAYALMDKPALWNAINPHNCFIHRPQERLYDCRLCQALVGESVIDRHHECPRCHSRLHKRIPNSLQKTAALVLAACIFYIPANVLPFMTTRSFSGERNDTLISGVLALLKHDMWLVAAVVFIASIVVPIAKLLILSYLIYSVYRRSNHRIEHKLRLFHITEWVGRWSMVDVYVVTLLTALVQFGVLGNIQPGNALLAFAAVVVLTMLAAETFDPRLLQDNKPASPIPFSPAHEKSQVTSATKESL